MNTANTQTHISNGPLDSKNISACMDKLFRQAEVFSSFGTKGSAGANLMMVMANSALITCYHKLVTDEMQRGTSSAVHGEVDSAADVDIKEVETCMETLSSAAQWFTDLQTEEGLKNAAALQGAEAVLKEQICRMTIDGMSSHDALVALSNDEVAFSEKVMRLVKKASGGAA